MPNSQLWPFKKAKHAHSAESVEKFRSFDLACSHLRRVSVVQDLIKHKPNIALLTFLVTRFMCGFHVKELSNITPRLSASSTNGTSTPSPSSTPGRFKPFRVLILYSVPKNIALVFAALRRREALAVHSETCCAARDSRAMPSNI